LVQEQRRLAAILAADVAGYSRLMAADESGTLALMRRLRAEVIDPSTAQFQGRIVGSAGDSLLIEFASALNAVQCAVEMQDALAAANARLPEDRRMTFRMGINLGDVIADDGTIYGDGVNVAARLEKLAEPGTVCIARNVHDQVKGRLPYSFVDLGEQQLRNIAEPVRIYRIGMAAPTSGADAAGRGGTVERPSIAVLPFTNLSGDPEQQYFSDGITEDIITELSRFHQLIVIARHSSFQYRDVAGDVMRIGRELQVQYVVEGSIRRYGDRIRITAQLIDTAGGSHLWAQRYDRNLADLFDVQDEVAKMIVSALAVRIELEDLSKARRKPPDSMRAYDYWLRGKKWLDEWNAAASIEARNLLAKAIEIDPDFARGHASLAFAWEWCAFYSAWGVDAKTAHDNALRHARKAVTLDHTDQLPHIVLAWLHHERGEHEQAQQHLARAADINPNDADAMMNRAMILAIEGLAETAIGLAQLAIRLNPRHPDWYVAYLGSSLFCAKRFVEAAATMERAPDSVPEVRAIAAAACQMTGREGDARRHMQEFLRRYPEHWSGQPSARGLAEKVFTFKDPGDTERLVAAWCAAGMPE
jgi:TolB-like protein/Tfp pilus assembly protein PilF